MYEVMSKKLLVINILDILNKYSDAEHRLETKDFIDILRKEYGIGSRQESRKKKSVISVGMWI